MEDRNKEVWDVEHKDEETENRERNKTHKCSTLGQTPNNRLPRKREK